ncbi:MAG: hypothetical protein U0X74_16665 [Anaerolineales bacterium]
MICSDGLWGVVNEKERRSYYQRGAKLAPACQSMVDANAAGGPDNITVILAQLIG